MPIRITNTDRLAIDREFPVAALPVAGKPHARGQVLWYGMDNAWHHHISRSSPHYLKPYNFEIVIDESKILRLSNKKELLAFTERFCRPGEKKHERSTNIDWPAVAKEYAGIELSQHAASQWNDDRLQWVWGWDIASGCIWDASAITGSRKLPDTHPLIAPLSNTPRERG